MIARETETVNESFPRLRSMDAENDHSELSAFRVFLVVVDHSEEMIKALYYACRRAVRTGGRVALLYVQERAEFQHWLSVGELMREERRAEAETRLSELAEQVLSWSGSLPVFYFREGDRAEETQKLVSEEPRISIIVLAASVTGDPGPIISRLLNQNASRRPKPIAIVPGELSLEELDALC